MKRRVWTTIFKRKSILNDLKYGLSEMKVCVNGIF